MDEGALALDLIIFRIGPVDHAILNGEVATIGVGMVDYIVERQ